MKLLTAQQSKLFIWHGKNQLIRKVLGQIKLWRLKENKERRKRLSKRAISDSLAQNMSKQKK